MWCNLENAPWDNVIQGDLKRNYMPYGSLSFAISLCVLKAYFSSKKRVVKVLTKDVYCIHRHTLRKILDFYTDSERQKWENEVQPDTESGLFSPAYEIKSPSFHLLASCVSSVMLVF